MLTFQDIGPGDPRLSTFLAMAGDSLTTFRYFNKRDTSALQHHIYTILGIADTMPVSYGHLDKDGDTVWLGICVIASQRGKGYGTETMRALLAYADAHSIERVDLAVDADNVAAQRLYEKFGFAYKAIRYTRHAHC